MASPELSGQCLGGMVGTVVGGVLIQLLCAKELLDLMELRLLLFVVTPVVLR